MKRRKRAVIAVAAAIGLTTGFIFWFSLRSSFTSAAGSRQLLQLLSDLLSDGTVTEAWHHLLRKVAHFIEFALLGGEWMALTLLRGARRRWALPGALTAVADECLQFLAPGRAPRVTDVLLDWSGYLTGALLLLGGWWLWSRRRRKKGACNLPNRIV